MPTRRPTARRRTSPGAVEAAAAAAARYLIGQQSQAGAWLDFRFHFQPDGLTVVSNEWTTGFVGRALLESGLGPGSVRAAVNWLERHRHREGGWGYAPVVPPDADSTAAVLGFLAQAGSPVAGQFLEADLHAFWDPELEGFRTYRPRATNPRSFVRGSSSWCGIHASVTAAAAATLAWAPASAGNDRIREAVAARLAHARGARGCWECFWWTGTTYPTWAVLRCLGERGLSGPVRAAQECTARHQDPGGSWSSDESPAPSPFFTAFGALTLLLDPTDAFSSEIDAAIDWLLRNQGPDGTWEATPILRMPRPEVKWPGRGQPTTLLMPPLADERRLFTTAACLSALTCHSRRSHE